MPSTCDVARALAFLIDADELVRVALDDLDNLAGLPQLALAAAGLVLAQSHADHIAVGSVHRRTGRDIDIAGLVAPLGPLRPHEAKPLAVRRNVPMTMFLPHA